MILKLEKNVKKNNNLLTSEKILSFKGFNPNYIIDKMSNIKKFGIWCVLMSSNKRFHNKITSKQTESYFVDELKSLKKPIYHDYFILYHTLSHSIHFGSKDTIDLSIDKEINENIFKIKKIVERELSLGKEKFIINYSQRDHNNNFTMTYAQVEKETFLIFFREFLDYNDYSKNYFRCFQIFQIEFSPILNYLKFDLISEKTGV